MNRVGKFGDEWNSRWIYSAAGKKSTHLTKSELVCCLARSRLLGIASDTNDANRGWLIWFFMRRIFSVSNVIRFFCVFML